MSPASAVPTILLIDDEASIRAPLRLALIREGYRVWEATNGEEGLAFMADRGDEISIVILDNHMPRVSGGAVIEELRRRRISVPIILMSGVGIEDAGLGQAEPNVFLRKPFGLTELMHHVQQLLGTEQRASA